MDESNHHKTSHQHHDHDHEIQSVLRTIDFTLFMVTSFACFLLFTWWVYVLYFSSYSQSTATTRVRAKSASSATEQPSTEQSDPKTSQHNPIEAEMYKQSSGKHVQKHITQPDILRCSKLLCTFSICCSAVNLLIHSIMWILYPEADAGKSKIHSQTSTAIKMKIHCSVTTFNFALSVMSRWFLYFYYVHRIKIIFSGSMFRLSSTKYKWLIGYISVSHILSALFFVTIQSIYSCDWSMLLYALSFPLINDLTVAIFCLCYFLRKLRTLLSYSSASAPAKATEVMKQTMTKIALLTTVTIVTSIISVITTSFGFFTIIAVNELVNNICLVLSFSFVDYYYKKLCCLCLICLKMCNGGK